MGAASCGLDCDAIRPIDPPTLRRPTAKRHAASVESLAGNFGSRPKDISIPANLITTSKKMIEALEMPGRHCPLALRQEEEYPSCRSERGGRGATTHRIAARNVGPFDPAHARTRAAARLGNFRAHPPDLERGIAGAAGLA